MIQRIQTLFLLAAFAATLLMILIPFNVLTNDHGEPLKLFFTGLKNMETGTYVFKAIPLAGVTVLSALLSLVTIFVYQNRTLQMRLCVYNILLTLALIVLIVIYYFIIKNNIGIRLSSFSFTGILPVVNIILIFQAFRAIRRDDLLIKSYNRLR